MYPTITIYELFYLFCERYQPVKLYDNNSGTFVFEGTIDDYEGPNYAVDSIDVLSPLSEYPDFVEDDTIPSITINISVD